MRAVISKMSYQELAVFILIILNFLIKRLWSCAIKLKDINNRLIMIGLKL